MNHEKLLALAITVLLLTSYFLPIYKMIRILVSIYLLAITTLAAPPQLGLKFDKNAGGLPTLTLPYATYRAASYNPNGEVAFPRYQQILFYLIEPSRSMSSRISGMPLRLSVTSAGLNPRHPLPSRAFKMAPTVQSVIKRPWETQALEMAGNSSQD